MKHWKPTTTRASTERGRPDPGSELVEVGRATEMQQRSRPVLPDVDFPVRERDLIDLFGPRHHSVRPWSSRAARSRRAKEDSVAAGGAALIHTGFTRCLLVERSLVEQVSVPQPDRSCPSRPLRVPATRHAGPGSAGRGRPNRSRPRSVRSATPWPRTASPEDGAAPPRRPRASSSSRLPLGERTSCESAPGSGRAIARHSHSGPSLDSPLLASALDGDPDRVSVAMKNAGREPDRRCSSSAVDGPHGTDTPD